MKKNLHPFIGKNILLTSLGLALAYLGYKYFNITAHPFYVFLVPFIALAINVAAFAFATNDSSKKNTNTLIAALFGIKFFSYIIVATVFFLLEAQKDIRLLFILYLFFIYILNTVYLLTKTLKYLKE